MERFRLEDLTVNLYKKGAQRYTKVSYPIKYGCYTEIIHPEYYFSFNLNQEVKYIQGKNSSWPHPSEWLKRTPGNDWIYYYSGGYNDMYDCLGEYYLPCFNYPTNSLWKRKPFADQSVLSAIQAWKNLRIRLKDIFDQGIKSDHLRECIKQIVRNSPNRLWQRALRLFSINKARVSVLPPDTRHVDYEVIPVMISDGCLYNCGFCSVKTGQEFRQRSKTDILNQLIALKEHYGPDLANYSGIFLGQHDALNCHPELIVYALKKAEQIFQLEKGYIKGNYLFLFGSVDSIIKAPESLFNSLNQLPYLTYINLGLESANQETLDFLRKPLSDSAVLEAFARKMEINRKYENLEVTSNFILENDLPAGHWRSLQELVKDGLNHTWPKGTIYLSPLSARKRNEKVKLFKEIKFKSRLPVFLYLLQRL